MVQDYEHWHWQQFGTTWKGIGIYHVTLTVPSREPLFGKLVILDNDPKQARVQRTKLGMSIRSVIRGFWQGAKRLGREYTSSIDPEFNSGLTL